MMKSPHYPTVLNPGFTCAVKSAVRGGDFDIQHSIFIIRYSAVASEQPQIS